MPRQAWSSEDLLTKWVIEQTRHLDLVASWETLLDVYATLGFTDPINDNSRLDEFKWIIRETNKFLTRMRNGLNKAKDFEASDMQDIAKEFHTRVKNITDALSYNP